MNEFQLKIGIENPDWLMSSREKLVLIGLLECIKPSSVIEFGYHRGGATNWLAKFAQRIISVDVNEFVNDADKKFPNVEAWNCPTNEAIKRIKAKNLKFDLAVIDADHSRKAVAMDISGLLNHTNIILMHDSFNPACRKGMLDALKDQKTHAYYLDFVPSVSKKDGLWGGLAVAWKSETPKRYQEFKQEFSSYPPLCLQNYFQLSAHVSSIKQKFHSTKCLLINNLRIYFGKLLGR